MLVSRVYIYIKNYPVLYHKHNQLIAHQLHLNKAIKTWIKCLKIFYVPWYSNSMPIIYPNERKQEEKEKKKKLSTVLYNYNAGDSRNWRRRTTSLRSASENQWGLKHLSKTLSQKQTNEQNNNTEYMYKYLAIKMFIIYSISNRKKSEISLNVKVKSIKLINK